MKVAIIDLGSGNLNSVYKKLYQLATHPFVATTAADVQKADKIILPGVGHFQKASSYLKSSHMYDSLNEAVLVRKVPVLGICLGMQLMGTRSEEGNASGFGWINTDVVKFKIINSVKFKIPHIGWNTLKICNKSRLLKNIGDSSEFYFLHAYHFGTVEQSLVTASTDYGYEFTSVIEKDNVFATQFHPEQKATLRFAAA